MSSPPSPQKSVPAPQPTSLSFHGGALELLAYTIVLIASMIPVVTYAWGVTKLYRWAVENISFADGTRASFEGQPKAVLLPFSILVILGYVSILLGLAEIPFGVYLLITLLLIPLYVVVFLPVIRWQCASIALSSGSELAFTGSYGGLLGWYLVTTLAGYTIIGGPFAVVGWARWICRHVEGGRRRLTFTGSGLGLLGQMIITFLLCLLIVTIPYAMVRLWRWFVSNLRLEIPT